KLTWLPAALSWKPGLSRVIVLEFWFGLPFWTWSSTSQENETVVVSPPALAVIVGVYRVPLPPGVGTVAGVMVPEMLPVAPSMPSPFGRPDALKLTGSLPCSVKLTGRLITSPTWLFWRPGLMIVNWLVSLTCQVNV